jgi:hypothetical protein
VSAPDSDDPRSCETEWCTVPFLFTVSVGSRQHDAQKSCRRHLAATVTAMAEAESPRHVVIQVIYGKASNGG